MQALFTQASFMFFLLGLFSMGLHALKKYAAGEIRGGILDWYLMHPRATLQAVIACVGGIATAILSGALNDYTVGAQVLAAAGIGFSADTLNKQGKQ